MMTWAPSARQMRSEDTLNFTNRHDPDVSVQRPVGGYSNQSSGCFVYRGIRNERHAVKGQAILACGHNIQ